MDWSDVIRRFKDLRSLIDTKPVFRWGVVTNTDPLLVQLDGDDRPLAGSPSMIIGGLTTGSRILCLIQNRRVTVVGAVDGGAKPLPGSVSSGFNIVTAEYQERAGWLAVTLNVTGDVVQGSGVDVWSNLPEWMRPPSNRQAAAWMNGGYAGVAWVRWDGTIAVANRTGATRTSAQFTIVYPRQ